MLFATPHKLIFVALLLVQYGVDGVQITGLGARKHGSDEGPGPASTSSSMNISPIQNSPLPTHTSSTSATLTASTSLSSSSSLLSSGSLSSTRSLSSSGALSSSSSLSSNANSLAISASSAKARQVGTIVGSVLGSVILGSLALMTVAHFRRRARKARKQPRGSDFFNEPETEMTQTQNGLPLTSSAPLVHRPEPLHFFNRPSTNNTSPLSPLMPTATFLDATSSSLRPLSFSEFDNNSPSDSIQSPFDTHDLLLDTPLLQRAVSAGPALSSTSSQLSPLHRDMAGFQKTLETDHKRDNFDQSTIISNPIGDPPPKYVG